jgi:phosphoglycolate phosphatase-like HAD superfamily hydrolase
VRSTPADEPALRVSAAAVLSDLDGTLVDPWAMILQALSAVGEILKTVGPR